MAIEMSATLGEPLLARPVLASVVGRRFGRRGGVGLVVGRGATKCQNGSVFGFGRIRCGGQGSAVRGRGTKVEAALPGGRLEEAAIVAGDEPRVLGQQVELRQGPL